MIGRTFGIDFPYILPGAKAAENKIPTVSVPDFSSMAGGPIHPTLRV